MTWTSWGIIALVWIGIAAKTYPRTKNRREYKQDRQSSIMTDRKDSPETQAAVLLARWEWVRREFIKNCLDAPNRFEEGRRN